MMYVCGRSDPFSFLPSSAPFYDLLQQLGNGYNNDVTHAIRKKQKQKQIQTVPRYKTKSVFKTLWSYKNDM